MLNQNKEDKLMIRYNWYVMIKIIIYRDGFAMRLFWPLESSNNPYQYWFIALRNPHMALISSINAL